MKLWPKDSFRLRVLTSGEEIIQTLEENTEAPKLRIHHFRPKNYKPFVGRIRENGFDIARNLGYRNSFRPDIHGQFFCDREYRMTAIRVTMGLGLFPVVFFISFFGFIFVMGGAIFLDQLLKTGPEPFSQSAVNMLLFLSGFVLFAIGLTLAGFWPEARIGREKLLKILEGKAVLEPPGRNKKG